MCSGKKKKKDKKKKKSGKPFWWTSTASRTSPEQAANAEGSRKNKDQMSPLPASERTSPTETSSSPRRPSKTGQSAPAQRQQSDLTREITAKIQKLKVEHRTELSWLNPKPAAQTAPGEKTSNTKVNSRRKSAIPNTDTSVQMNNRADTDKNKAKEAIEKLTKPRKQKPRLNNSESIKDIVEKLLQRNKQNREMAKKSLELKRSAEGSKSKSINKSNLPGPKSSSPLGDVLLLPTASRRQSTRTRESSRPPSVRMKLSSPPTGLTSPAVPAASATPSQVPNGPMPIQHQAKQTQPKQAKAEKDTPDVSKTKKDAHKDEKDKPQK